MCMYALVVGACIASERGTRLVAFSIPFIYTLQYTMYVYAHTYRQTKVYPLFYRVLCSINEI